MALEPSLMPAEALSAVTLEEEMIIVLPSASPTRASAVARTPAFTVVPRITIVLPLAEVP